MFAFWDIELMRYSASVILSSWDIQWGGSPSGILSSRPPQSNIGPWAPPKVDIDTPPQKRWGTHVDIGALAQKPRGADPDIELRFPEALGT